jgi:HD-GYP domain-containing protein (c-di-GMP phosphodiesterase class II)
MTSDRTYRPGLSMEEALAEIARCSGTQFDPRVVDAMMSAVQSGRFTLIGRGELQRPDGRRQCGAATR